MLNRLLKKDVTEKQCVKIGNNAEKQCVKIGNTTEKQCVKIGKYND